VSLHRHNSGNTSSGNPWVVLGRNQEGVASRRLTMTLDSLLVTILVVIAVAVHW
jgi:hypothetical protein